MKTETIISASILAIAGIVGVVLVNMQSQKALKDRAVSECLQVSRVESSLDKNRFIEPMKDWYTFCMKEKGYK